MKRKSQRGHAIVEFAIGWGVLWLLFSGVYQYGYGFYVYNLLMTQVSNAVELGAKLSYDTGDPSAYITTLQNMVLYGDETQGTSTVVPNLSANQVNVTVTTDVNSIPTNVTIEIGSTTTPYVISGVFGSINLRGKPRATFKYLGQVACSTC